MDAKCLLRAIDAVAVGGGHPSQGDKPTSTPKSDKANIWNPPADNIMAVMCSSCSMVLVVLGV